MHVLRACRKGVSVALFSVPATQFAQLLADADFESAIDRFVEDLALQAVGQVLLAGRETALLVVRVAIALAVVELLHELGRGIAQMHGHGPRAVFLDQRAHRVVGRVDRVRLRRHREIDHALRQREFALGRAQALVDLGRVEREPQRARVGQADVLARHAHQPARHVARVCAAVEHAHEPVERGVGIAAAYRFMQRADGVVELLAALVVAPHALAEHAQQPFVADGLELLGARRDGQRLERVEQPARIAVGIGDQPVERGVLDGGQCVDGLRLRDDLLEVGLAERLQHIHGGPREQRRVDLERRVLGGGADEGEEARLDVRQEGVLLALVEDQYDAMHLL